MDLAWFLGLYTVIVVLVVTPGPANVVMLASGLQFGIQRSWPLYWGLTVGFILLHLSVALGLGVVLQRYPLLQKTLAWLGIVYFLYLAWRMLGVMQDSVKNRIRHPYSFGMGAFLVLLNIKGWMGTMYTFSLFQIADMNVWVFALIFTVAFTSIGLPNGYLWMSCGNLIQQRLKNARLRRGIEWLLAASLLGMSGSIAFKQLTT